LEKSDLINRNMQLIGVDIGGSHISAARVSFLKGKTFVSEFKDRAMDTNKAAELIISTWASVIREVTQGDKAYKVGIAMPGPYDYPNGISLIEDQEKMRALFGLSVKNLLANELEVSANSIIFTNDAEAFLLGESIAGAGRGFQNSIGITLGTGLGSAIKIQNQVQDAKLWTAPFRDGIAEDYLGTAWFQVFAADRYQLEIKGVKDLVQHGFDQTIADQIFRIFGDTFGEFLLPYIRKNKAEGVILGGKIALVADRFLPYTIDFLKKSAVDIPIQVSELGEKSALIGACHPFLIQSV
jgi:glucokinase